MTLFTKQSKTRSLLRVLLVVLAFFVGACGFVAQDADQTATSPPALSDDAQPPETTDEQPEMEPNEELGQTIVDDSEVERATSPLGFTIFQDYLDVIGGRAGQSERVLVEATILSLNQLEACPTTQNPCPIEPYPNDWGLVRIDTILASNSTDTETGNPTEGVSSSDAAANDADSSENRGETPSTADKSEAKRVPPLEEGQEVEALFVLSTRPAIARKIAYAQTDIDSAGTNIERGQALNSEQARATDSHEMQPGGKQYHPIPREDGILVFTTSISADSPEQETVLPGLAVGSRFRAEIDYNGVLYVKEYELLAAE